VWQGKDLKSNDFGSVARKGVIGGLFGSVARKGLSDWWGARRTAGTEGLTGRVCGVKFKRHYSISVQFVNGYL